MLVFKLLTHSTTLITFYLTRGFPNWGTFTYLKGYIYLSEGVHLRLATEGQTIFIYYLFPYILKYKSSIKIRWIFVISLSFFVIRNIRGTR